MIDCFYLKELKWILVFFMYIYVFYDIECLIGLMIYMKIKIFKLVKEM